MPVLHRLAQERLSDGALRGRRLAVVVHLEAKTACLVLALRAAGADVVAAGSNPLSTQDSVCAALVERGVEVQARHGVTPAEFTADLLAVAERGPELVIDDGLELTRRIAEHRPDLYERLEGVSEETTTGVARLRALERRGQPAVPRDRRERRAVQAHLRQHLRDRAEHADRGARAHEPARGRPRVLHRRLRLGGQGSREGRPRGRRPRDRRRARPGAGADRAHGRLPGRAARGGAAGRGRGPHGHRPDRCRRRGRHPVPEGRRGARERRALRPRDRRPPRLRQPRIVCSTRART